MYIVHVGASNFPKGSAAIQRIRITYKAIKNSGFETLIINKESTRLNSKTKRSNRFEGTPYVFTSFSLKKHPNRIINKLNKLSGVFGELKLLFKKRKQISVIILYNTSSFTELVYYRLISKILHFKLIFQYVEFRSSFEKDSITQKINDKLFDRYCSYFTDGVIVISEFLRNEIRKRNSLLPLIKIPVICDFNEFDKVSPAQIDYPYFLYCGSDQYIPVINFIIDLYTKARDTNIYEGNLVLVIAVSAEKNMEQVKSKISANKYCNCILLTGNLTYNNLIGYYKSADLLLIPLRNSIQDTARFPHKIGEYTASKKPLLSTNSGELKYYFENNKSAILAEEYSLDAYLEALKTALTSENNLDDIGKNAYDVGHANFHYQSLESSLKLFLDSICNQNFQEQPLPQSIN